MAATSNHLVGGKTGAWVSNHRFLAARSYVNLPEVPNWKVGLVASMVRSAPGARTGNW